MNRKKLYLYLNAIVIVLAVTSCSFGKKTPSVPTIDPSILATHAAGTAQASAQQTQQASIPTAIPPTSTPKISPITGTSLVTLEDQSTLFIDSKAGVQLIVPPGWLAVRPNEDEYYKAFGLNEVLSSSEINDRLTKLQSANTDYFRLDAIDLRPDHVVNGIITVMSVNYQPDDFRSLEKWAQSEINKKSPFQGYKLLGSSYRKNADGSHALVIEETWKGSPNGTLYHRELFFSIPSGTLIIDLQINRDLKDTLLPEFEQVINSLTLTSK
jgi:hypothetical protein